MDLFGILLLILILLVLIVIVWIYRRYRKKLYIKLLEEKKLLATEQTKHEERILKSSFDQTDYHAYKKHSGEHRYLRWYRKIPDLKEDITTIKRDLLVEYENPMENGEKYYINVTIIKEMGDYFTDENSEKKEIKFFSIEKEPIIKVRARSKDFTFISSPIVYIKIFKNKNISKTSNFEIKPKSSLSGNKAKISFDAFYDNISILNGTLEIEINVQKKLLGTSSKNGLAGSGISAFLQVVNQLLTFESNLLSSEIGTLLYGSITVILFVLFFIELYQFSRSSIKLSHKTPGLLSTYPNKSLLQLYNRLLKRELN